MKPAQKLFKLFAAQPAARTQVVAPAPLLRALEPRIVYEASVVAAPVAHTAGSHHHSEHDFDARSTAVPGEGVTPGGTGSGARADHGKYSSQSNQASDKASAQSTTTGTTVSTVSTSGAQPEKEVVFIDSSVTDYQELVAGLPPGTTWVLLNPNESGFAQMAAYLQGKSGIDAIQILSHGSEGELQVGSAVLTDGNISEYAVQLQEIGAALKPGGDILLYGCDVGKGADGAALVEAIGILTGANVAASDTPVGAASLGGNWALDTVYGTVTTPEIFSAASERAYGYLLTSTTENYTETNAINLTQTTDVTSFTLNGITYTMDVAVESNVQNDGSLQPVTGDTQALFLDTDGQPYFNSVTISLSNHDNFNLTTLDLDILSGAGGTEPNGTSVGPDNLFTITPGSNSAGAMQYDDPSGMYFTGNVFAPPSGDTGFISNFSSSNFTNISSFTISGVDMIVDIGRITYTDVNPLTLTAGSGNAGFTEANPYTSNAPVTISSGIGLTNGNNSAITSATVTLTNAQTGDSLGFSNINGTTFGNIAGNYSSGVLTLTSLGGTATSSQWKAALDAVTFTNDVASPGTTARTVTFSVTNTYGVTSNTITETVSVTHTDQSPVVTTSSGTTTYYADTAATTIDSSVSVSDADNATQASGTVSIASGFASGDTLGFTSNPSTMGNITGAYDSGTGVLTLTSASASATDAQWDAALQAVTFSSTSTTYGDRTIAFVANDGIDSSAAAVKTVDVLNPDPVMTTDAGSAAFVAGNNVTSTPVAVDSGLNVTDPAASTLASATVAITGNFQSGEDVLGLTGNAATMGNIAGTYDATTGVLTLSSASNTATLAEWKTALESVTYTDTAITPNNATRTISFAVTDTNSNTSNTATRTVTVADTDQTPIVTTTGGTTTYLGGASAATIDGGITVTDRDNTTQASGTVSITSGFHSGDVLAFTNNGTTMGNISGSYNASTGVLTLTSASATATDAQWDAALQAVTFASTSTTYGNRTIAFVANDGTENSAAATDTVNVLNPDPVVTTDSGSAAFVAGDNVASTPVAVDAGLSVTDPGTPTLTGATVSVAGNFHSGEDMLGFTNNGTMGDIAGTYDATTGVLTLSSTSNTATLAEWKAALDAVTYTDTAITPNNATRTISFSVSDIGGNVSTTATRTVTVTDTDQTPVVTTTGGTTNYVGGMSAVTVDGGVTVSDRDNTTQASGTASVTSGFHSGDTLTFVNTNSPTYGNIVGSYDASTGVLTLTSSGATATDAQWANAFSAVTFSAGASATPGDRTISFVANDGTENSAAATKTLDVLGPPTVTTDSGSAAFVAGDNVTSTPVTIDSGLSVVDPATPTLASATVSITGNFQNGEDVLAFTNDSSTMGNIGASYNAATGELTLTSSNNTASLAQWQAALDAVTYTDTAITPNNATRTVSFAITDSNDTASNTATRTVTVADTVQTPIMTTTGGTKSYVAGTTPVTIGGVTVSDRGNTLPASGTVSISGGFQSGDTLTFTNTSSTLYGDISASYNASTGVLTLTSAAPLPTDAQWANAFGAVTFSAGASAAPGNRTISLVVTDGGKSSVAVTDTVDVLAPLTLTTHAGSTAFVAGDNVASTPVTVDSGLSVADPGAPTLASATVSITGNFQSGEDVLAFANNGTMGNIAGAYNATTGVLTLGSAGDTASLAQWQAALDAVTYTDTAITPNDATRTIGFAATDSHGVTSNTATRAVTVTDTDQTPIMTTTGGTTDYVAGTTPVTIGGVTVSDRDNTTQASGTVSIGSGFQSGDTLAFSNTSSTLYGNISASYDASTGALTLTSSGATATDAQWANAFDAVTFSSGASATPGNRTISFTVNDGTKSSAAATDTVDVLAPLTLSTDSGSTAFVAGDNVTSRPVTVDSGLTVTDGGTSKLASATVAIAGNFQSGEDMLALVNNGSTMGNIGGSYDAATGVLTLTSAGNTATAAQWQAALDAVTYTDTAITPNNATRAISFTATDSNGNTSNAATRTVTVADADQTPIVTTGGTTSYVPDTAPVTIGGGVSVSDRDNTTQASGTVSIAGGFQSGDMLTFTNTSSTRFGDISASYNASTGALTLTSSGATATDAQWANALSVVTFFAGAEATPGNRTISFVVSDGTKTSAAATATVAVLESPAAVTSNVLPSSTFINSLPQPSDAATNVLPGVLDEPVQGQTPGVIPGLQLQPVQPITFTDSHSTVRHVSLDLTSVTAQPHGESTGSLASNPLSLPTFQIQPTVVDYDVAPDKAFSVDLSSLLSSADGTHLYAGSDVLIGLADGRPLPAWLHYDAAAGTLVGILPAGAHDVRVLVQTRGADGSVIRNVVVLAPRTQHAQPHASRGALAPFVERVTDHAPVPAGKPSLAQQFARERAALHVVRPSTAAIGVVAAANPATGRAPAKTSPIPEHRA